MAAGSEVLKCRWLQSSIETTCFGYQPVFKFETQTEATTQPKISSASTGSNFCVLAVDSLLAAALHENVHLKVLDDIIDAITISEGGLMAMAHKENISIGIVTDNGIHIYKSHAFLKTGDLFVKLSLQIVKSMDDSQEARLVGLSSKGVLIVVNNIVLVTATKELDISGVTVEHLAPPHEKTLHFATTEDHIITVGSGSDCLAVFSSDDGKFILNDSAALDDDSEHLVHVSASSLGNTYFTLSSKGIFSIWAGMILCITHSVQLPPVTDIRLVETRAKKIFSLENVRLIVARDDRVEVMTLELMATTLQVKTAGSAKLTSLPVTLDDVYVAEWTHDDDEILGEATVTLCCHSETPPEVRLQRLIGKKRYQEAEQFALLHGLPFNLNHLIVKQKLHDAKDSFDAMSRHIADCKKQLLRGESKDSAWTQVMAEVKNLEELLEKYQVIFGKASYSLQSWKVFQMETPQKMFSSLIMESAEKAFRLWKCFQGVLLKEMKPGVIMGIVQRIQPSVPCMVTASWLCELVPAIVAKDPNSMPSLINWIEELVYYQEENQIEWPDLAIKFCSTLHQSLDSATSTSLDDFVQNSTKDFQNRQLCSAAVAPLECLVQNLMELQTLQAKYSFHIQLAVLKKESKESIAYRMLDSVVAVDFMPEALSKQILPYLQHNKLQTDQVLVNYVQELFKNSTVGELQYSFEEKVHFIIKFIKSPRKKIEAMMKLLENVTLPVPTFVKDLVHLVIHNSQDPMVKLLQDKWKLRERDSIIVSYGYKPAAVNTDYYVMVVCKSILASGGPIGDAIKVLDSGTMLDKCLPDLHYFQCFLYITRNEVEKIHMYLKELPVKMSLYCCQMVLRTAVEMMTTAEDVLAEEMKPNRMRFYDAADIAGPILESLMHDLDQQKEFKQLRQIVKNARNLEVHFNLLYDREIFESRQRRTEAFQKAAGQFKTSDMLRLAQFLAVSDGGVIKTAIQIRAGRSKAPSERKFLLHLADLTPPKMAMDCTVQDVLTLLDKEEIKHPSLCQKLSPLFISCPADQIINVKTMCKLANLMVEAWKQSQPLVDDPLKLVVNVYQDRPSPSLDLEELLSGLVDVTLMATSQASRVTVWKETSSLVATLCTHNQLLLAQHTLIHVMALLDSRAPCPDDDGDCSATTAEMKRQLKEISSSLVVEILKTPSYDGKPAVAHLLSLTKTEAMELMESIVHSAGTNYTKLKCISMVGLQWAEILKDGSLIEKFQKVQVTAKWGARLQKIGIKLSAGPICSLVESIEAVEKLVKSPHCTLEILEEYFSDSDMFEIHMGKYMVELFKSCLREPLFTLEVQRRAELILTRVRGREKLQVLKRSLYETHSYNYEVLEYLLSAICGLEELEETVNGLELLRYLKMYTRSSPPGQEEKIHLVSSDGEVILPTDLSAPNSLPDISSTRLPFHMLRKRNYLLNVLDPELNTKTLDFWLGMAHVLQISRTRLIKTTATGLMNAYVATSTSSETSTEISPEFLPLLENLKNVLCRIREMKVAVIVGHDMLKNFKSVGEKTLAIQKFTLFVELWLDSTNHPEEKAEAREALDSYKQRFRRYSAQWTLLKAGILVDGKVSSLLEEPKDLIIYLYSLPCVTDPAKSSTDINAVCDSIAELYEVNVQHLRESLLDKWLLGVSALDCDQTMTFGNVSSGEDNVGNLSRVLYVLRSTGRTNCLKYLSSFLSLTEDMLSPQNRTQVLYCINRCCSTEEIARYVPVQ